MALNNWGLTSSSYVLIEGDSETDWLGTVNSRLQLPLLQAVYAKYSGTPTVVNGQVRFLKPEFCFKSVNGSTINTVAGRIATELGAQNFTHVLLCIGTNENGRTRVQTQADLVTLFGAFTTQKVLTVGPYTRGEKYPSGQNVPADDQRMDETDIDINAQVALYANGLYVSMRGAIGGGNTLYNAIMPPLNTPSPGVTSGPFTTPDAGGVHYNASGRAAAYGVWGTRVSLS